ncbi:MAG: aspartate carbamoyltransferase, partial [Muribaculaceae bacterium]|nr:aspartate carbamoyltransferase [Muribaculaceae bacterium]
MTRVQKERFFDEDEYDRVKDFFILDAEKLKLARPEMRILHPLPRVNEISTDVDSDPRAAYFRQVENGKFVRMALICKLLEWAKDPEKTTKLVPDDAVRGKFTCRNKRCISNMEVGVESLFRPAHDNSGDYRCVYCESKPK